MSVAEKVAAAASIVALKSAATAKDHARIAEERLQHRCQGFKP